MEVALSELATKSTLGLLLVISLMTTFYLGKMLLYEKDKRIEDATKSRDSVAAPLEEIKESLAFIERKIKVSKDE